MTVETESSFRAGIPQQVLENQYFSGDFGRQYDISPDSRRFLMLKETAEAMDSEPPQLVLAQNWFEELKRLVPVN